MYIVAIAWLYVVVLMALAEGLAAGGSWLGAAITFVLYGVLPGSIVLYLRRHAGAARRAAPRRGVSARAIQTAAAMRPVTPSRRYEKNRDASLTVHQRAAADPRRRRPPPAGRAPGRRGRRATWRRLRPRSGRREPRFVPGAAPNAIEHVGADLERVRADAGAEPGDDVARRAAGRPAQSASTVASSTPAGKPAPARVRRGDGAPVAAPRTAPAGSRPPGRCRRRPARW